MNRYGDIGPTNPSEMVFVTVVMLVGISIFGLLLGNATQLVANSNAERMKYNEKMEEISSYLGSRNVPRHLSRKLKK